LVKTVVSEASLHVKQPQTRLTYRRWDNLNIHLAPELTGYAAENKDWLRIYRLPAYAPDLNPVEMGLPQCEFRRSSLA
jgi:transposase